MKGLDRTGGDGVRTARALLSLIEEYSSEDFQAAEAILGGQKELVRVLALLRTFKDHTSEESEPLSPEVLRALVRRELLDLPVDKADVSRIIANTFGVVPRMPPSASLEDAVDQGIQVVEGRSRSASPGYYVAGLVNYLRSVADRAGPEHADRIEFLLRELAARAIAENLVVFPTLHAISELRTEWAPVPLQYGSQEARRDLAARLLKDAAAHLDPNKLAEITRNLLVEGLRGPADRAIAETRRMNAKKAHGK